MIPTGNPQINTKLYWNYIYTTPAKEKEYWGGSDRYLFAMNYIKDGDRFIDLGCGVGIPGRMVREKKKNCEVWGVDISDEIIEKNKKDSSDIKYFQGYIGALDFLPKDYFDVVFCGETIEHLDRPEDAFIDAFRILKKGGKLIITTPRELGLISPEHIWFFDKNDMDRLFKDAGFSAIEYVDLPDLEYKCVFFVAGTK